MKKLLCAILLTLTLSAPSLAAATWISTINDRTVEDVQDIVIEVFTGKNFSINDVTPFKMEFQKNFGDGLLLASMNQTVRINLLERDGNIRMMVTQTEVRNGFIKRQRSIDHLIPMLKEIKNIADGTPIEMIANEAVNQLPGSGNKRAKELGLELSNDKDSNGYVTIKEVKSGSLANDAKLQPLDVIEDINGRSTSDMDIKTINSYMATRMAKGSSIMITYRRDGKADITTIKPPVPEEQ